MGKRWSGDELDFIRDTMDRPVSEVASALGRSEASVEQARTRSRHGREEAVAAVPLVKSPGEYIETLSAYLVDDWECMEIWMRWNGYAAYRELSRDPGGVFGHVTVLCTAK
jgi:hypothetical protein